MVRWCEMKIKRTRFIAVHLMNDFSGSPRVLADLCAIDTIQASSLTIVTNSLDGFLRSNLGSMSFFWYPRVGQKGLKLLAFLAAQLQIFFIVLAQCVKSRCLGERVVVINNTILSLSSMIAGRLMGALTVSYVHELSRNKFFTKNITQLVISHAADEVLVVSKMLLDHYNFRRCNITILPNGLRSDFKAVSCINDSKKLKYKNILFVGSLKKYKGIFQLIKIAECLPETSFQAILNCEPTELCRFKSDTAVPKNLTMLSRVDNLQDCYLKAFILLNLSVSPDCIESFGLTILEGMSAGCPCVVPPEGGHMEYFDPGTGLAVDSRDTKTIVNFIHKLQTDLPLWRDYSRQARSVASRFSSESYRHRANSLILRMVETRWDTKKHDI